MGAAAIGGGGGDGECKGASDLSQPLQSKSSVGHGAGGGTVNRDVNLVKVQVHNLTTPWPKARKNLNLRSKFKNFS